MPNAAPVRIVRPQGSLQLARRRPRMTTPDRNVTAALQRNHHRARGTSFYVAPEPHIDAETMQIHHDKHHQAYVTNLNAALDKHPELYEQTLEELLRGINRVPDDIRTAVRNNSGGHHNHSLFWTIMAPAGKAGGGEPSGTLADAIKKAFGGFAPFKEQLSTAGTARFGSGWAWLAFASGQLEVVGTADQGRPLMEGKIPVLGLDVWEHAYYLKYQNRRADYVAAWWNVVNWRTEVAKRYEAART